MFRLIKRLRPGAMPYQAGHIIFYGKKIINFIENFRPVRNIFFMMRVLLLDEKCIQGENPHRIQ